MKKICYNHSMELIKKLWEEEDKKEFQDYLKSLSKGEEKAQWEQRIVNTQLPCLAVSSINIDEIVSQISKGNFLSFLDLWIWEYHSNTIINGKLICKIKEFDALKKYLLKYSKQVDNWSSTDCLKFKFTKENEKKFIEFSAELLNCKETFARRLGVIIMLKLCKNTLFTDEILNNVKKLNSEKEYYVNMAVAWLLAELFIHNRTKTLQFLEREKLNKFIINKMISKCRDSFRISLEDKEMLLKFKKK